MGLVVSWYQAGLPGGADSASQQGSFLLRGELHDTRGLKLLADPLTLVQVIDKHELHAYVLAVRHLWTHTLCTDYLHHVH